MLQPASLIRSSGPNAGVRHPVDGNVVRLGRAPDNDIVVQGPDAAGVSAYHAEICREGNTYRIRDAGSTNGTYVDGQRITEAALTGYSTIQLGAGGPELAFVPEQPAPPNLDRTMELPPGAGAAPALEPGW